MASTEDEVPLVEVSAPRSDEVIEEAIIVTKKTEPKKPSASPVPRDENLEETRPRQSSSKQASSSSSSKHKSSSSHKSSTKSYHSSSQPRDYSDRLGIGGFSREFRGMSPSVVENIATHPLLFNKGYEPLINPILSAKSKKVIRDTSDLGVYAPGLKALLEVCVLKLKRTKHYLDVVFLNVISSLVVALL